MKYKTSKYNKLLHVGIGTFAGSAGVEDDDEAAITVIIYLMTFLVFSISFHYGHFSVLPAPDPPLKYE